MSHYNIYRKNMHPFYDDIILLLIIIILDIIIMNILYSILIQLFKQKVLR